MSTERHMLDLAHLLDLAHRGRHPMRQRTHETYEVTQPWVIYRYGLTHDHWWPFWNSTRILGWARIGIECAVCGDRTVQAIRIPRVGPVPEPESGRHPMREVFLRDHAHPDRGHPMSWARPLRNPAAHHDGINLDLLAMRLDGDLGQTTEHRDGPR